MTVIDLISNNETVNTLNRDVHGASQDVKMPS